MDEPLFGHDRLDAAFDRADERMRNALSRIESDRLADVDAVTDELVEAGSLNPIAIYRTKAGIDPQLTPERVEVTLTIPTSHLNAVRNNEPPTGWVEATPMYDDGRWDKRDPSIILRKSFPAGTDAEEIRAWASGIADQLEAWANSVNTKIAAHRAGLFGAARQLAIARRDHYAAQDQLRRDLGGGI